MRPHPAAHAPPPPAAGRTDAQRSSLPTLDVIIPCFNQAKYLGQAIASALAQTYPRVAVTVVDDGSTDDSAAIAQGYGDRIRYLHVPHGGLSAARNAGVLATNGDYVLFLDGDDYLAPTAVSRHMAMAATHPTAAVLHSGWEYVDERGGSVVEAGPYPLADDPFHMILRGYCPPVHSLVVRRDVLLSTGPFDEKLRLQEDRDMWLRIAASGHRFETVPETLATYRRHPTSMSAMATSAAVLDATATVIRKNQTRHSHCATCAGIVAGSLHDWRMAHLRFLRDAVMGAGGLVGRAQAVARVPVAMVREPSLALSALLLCGRRVLAASDRAARAQGLSLFLQAIRLTRLAQRVGNGVPLLWLSAALADLPGLPSGVEAEAAHRATVRAGIRGTRWFGFRDTCLVRSLVLAALLSDHETVQLHVGLASSDAGESVLEGHAWVSLDGGIVGGPASAMAADGQRTEMVIPVQRGDSRYGADHVG